jgi:hypothetical protein
MMKPVDTCSAFWLRRVVRLDQQMISPCRTRSLASLPRQIIAGAGRFSSNFLYTQPQIGGSRAGRLSGQLQGGGGAPASGCAP